MVTPLTSNMLCSSLVTLGSRCTLRYASASKIRVASNVVSKAEEVGGNDIDAECSGKSTNLHAVSGIACVRGSAR